MVEKPQTWQHWHQVPVLSAKKFIKMSQYIVLKLKSYQCNYCVPQLLVRQTDSTIVAQPNPAFIHIVHMLWNTDDMWHVIKHNVMYTLTYRWGLLLAYGKPCCCSLITAKHELHSPVIIVFWFAEIIWLVTWGKCSYNVYTHMYSLFDILYK